MDGSCKWTAPSEPGRCTNSYGVLSITEIQEIIKAYNIVPVWDHKTQMKHITWGDNNWMGYDDEETWEAKAQYADQFCFGGQAFWSIVCISTFYS
jgi:chitinase